MAKATRLRGPTRPLEQRKAEAEVRLNLLSKRIERANLDKDIRADRLKLMRRRS